jgi:hypothetical protein
MTARQLSEIVVHFDERRALFSAVCDRLHAGDEAIVEIAEGDPPYVRFGVEGLPMVACQGPVRPVATTFEAYGVLPGLVALLRTAADVLGEPEVSSQ